MSYGALPFYSFSDWLAHQAGIACFCLCQNYNGGDKGFQQQQESDVHFFFYVAYVCAGVSV